jgi:hypothetical protein
VLEKQDAWKGVCAGAPRCAATPEADIARSSSSTSIRTR